jgi:translocator protein
MYNKKWYKKLKKSSLTPPDNIFGIVWPILYILLITSFYLIFSNKKCFPYCNQLTYFIIQIIFNLLWTTIFFKFKKIKTSLLIILIIIFFTIISYFKFYKINKIASYLLIPYLLWLFFAMYLNFFIVIKN